MTRDPLILTLDGPAGSGKSTIALRAARELNLPCLNSGAIYRAVTLAIVEAGGDFDDGDLVRSTVDSLPLSIVNDGVGPRYLLGDRDVTDRIKDPDITSKVFRIANEPEYRKLLVDRQRRYGERAGVVAEGRDMGTVIFPDAIVKIFLDAPTGERARRQHAELAARGISVSYEEVLESLKQRDDRDRGRQVAPLVAAPDAICIDTGSMTIEDVVVAVLGTVRERTQG